MKYEFEITISTDRNPNDLAVKLGKQEFKYKDKLAFHNFLEAINYANDLLIATNRNVHRIPRAFIMVNGRGYTYIRRLKFSKEKNALEEEISFDEDPDEIR